MAFGFGVPILDPPAERRVAQGNGSEPQHGKRGLGGRGLGVGGGGECRIETCFCFLGGGKMDT